MAQDQRKESVNIELKDPSYVKISNGAHMSYGGSQMWFSPNGADRGSGRLAGGGCGLVAMADFLLYWSRKNREQCPGLMHPLLENAEPDKERYIQYLRILDRKYLHVLPSVGVTGFQLALAMNLFFLREKLPLRASWKCFLSSPRMLGRMTELLQNDLPVIFSVGPNTPWVFGKKSIGMYRLENSGKLKKVDQVSRHYVMLTGIESGPEEGQTLLKISSWGRPYYLDYAEYREYVRKTGDSITSSMIYIREK